MESGGRTTMGESWMWWTLARGACLQCARAGIKRNALSRHYKPTPPSIQERRSEAHRAFTVTFSRNRSITNIVKNSSFIAMHHPTSDKDAGIIPLFRSEVKV